MGVYTEYKTINGVKYSRERTEYRDNFDGPWSEWEEVDETPMPFTPTMSYAEAAALVKRMKR